MSIHATIERIRFFAAYKGWAKGRFAREASINKTTLRNFHSKEWNPTREIIERLESVIPDDFQPECCDYKKKPKARAKTKPRRKRGES